MKMKLQRDERRVSQVTTSLLGQSRCTSVRQMRHASLPSERHPDSGRASVWLKAEDGGAERGGCRRRPEGAGEEMVHRHAGVPHPPGRPLPRLVPRLRCQKVSDFTLVSVKKKRFNFTALS